MKNAPVSKFPQCDFCAKYGVTRNAHYDGPTTLGPHAHMCTYHFGAVGIQGSSITVHFYLEKRERTGKLPGVES